jgi:type II secretory pathway pseudopilin PulG
VSPDKRPDVTKRRGVSRGLLSVIDFRRHSRIMAGGAFTILELVLALAILMLLAGAAVLSLDLFQTKQDLSEGSLQFGTVLRMAAIESRNIGKRVQLSFDCDGLVLVQYEQDPVGAPGTFTAYTNCSWLDSLPSKLVKVVRCDITAALSPGALAAQTQAFVPTGASSGSSTQPTPTAITSTITFYPDGTSDSAIIELADAKDVDTNKAVLELDGVNGTINTLTLSPTDLDTYYQQATDSGKIVVSQ